MTLKKASLMMQLGTIKDGHSHYGTVAEHQIINTYAETSGLEESAVTMHQRVRGRKLNKKT